VLEESRLFQAHSRSKLGDIIKRESVFFSLKGGRVSRAETLMLLVTEELNSSQNGEKIFTTKALRHKEGL
jgi:hypothetical protein